MVFVVAFAVSLLLMVIQGAPLLAAEDQSAEELAKKVQNPVADLISVPFQNNFNFDVGPEDDLQYVLNIQPVIPFHLSDKWNLITRTIVPIISQPGFTLRQDRVNGIGDIQFTAFLSPAKSEGLIWGAGPIRTVSDEQQRPPGRRSLGSRGIRSRTENFQGQPLGLWRSFNNVWSVGGSGSDPSYNNFLIQPFLNYNFPGGIYLSSSPIITANWKADSGDRWTVPLGGGAGKIVHFGRLPVNFQFRFSM